MRLHVPLAIALVSTLAVGCRPAPHDESLELRTYEVPKGTASSLVTTIKDVMWMGENKNVGRAVITPDGRLAVLAPAEVQSGVRALVDQVGKAPSAEDPTVELHYFLVVGRPGAPAQPESAGLAEIKPALDEIVKSQGPQTFTLAQRASLSSLHDEEGRLNNFSDELEIKQVAVQTSDSIYAKLSIRWKTDKLETRVHVEPGRFVVLGATGQHARDSEDTMYYVIRVAPRADGKGR